MFKKILIANRGEIAIRIMRAAKLLNIECVLPFSEADSGTLPVRLADYRVQLKGSSATETYLNIDKIIAAAIETGAEAIHPGYGFLSENADFARAVEKQGLVFIGPTPEQIEKAGSNAKARALAESLNIPLAKGSPSSNDFKELKKHAKSIGYPVMIKAVAGGSGRGMRIALEETLIEHALSEAADEAERGFKNRELYIEKFIETPRHVEVQVFGDGKGGVVSFGTRDCSCQRRNQKVIEEAPAPNLKIETKLIDAAIKFAQEVSYRGAGTVEFLVDKSGEKFFFLEMNTRIQVEHTVTEEAYGIDLVKLQIEVAAGKDLKGFKSPKSCQHSIEFRIYAEDPTDDFKPKSGTILYYLRPFGLGVREESWVEAGTKISPYYDSLMTKLIITAPTREEAISRAKVTLSLMTIEGVTNNLPFQRWLIGREDFANSTIDVGWLGRNYKGEGIYSNVVGPRVLPE